MPYDVNGNWIPPKISTDGSSPRVYWTDSADLIDKLIKSGDLDSGEDLSDLFKTGSTGGRVDEAEKTWWESANLTENERLWVIERYTHDYISGAITADHKEAGDWGLQFERIHDSGNEDVFDSRFKALGDSGAADDMRYAMLMGKEYTTDRGKRDGTNYNIDYAHYNESLAYRSTMADLVYDESLGFKGDMRVPFTTQRQLMEAKKILEQPGYAWDDGWVGINTMPYSDEELKAVVDFRKHNLTRHFDPETRVTTYLNPRDDRGLATKLYEERAAGNYTQLKQPGSPQWVNVVTGSPPKEKYNSEGTRLVADGDVRAMYARYLGRDYNNLIDTANHPDDPAKRVAIGKDEIAYWEGEADKNNWTYDDLVGRIKNSAEGKLKGDSGRIYYNPNGDKESEIRNKLTAEPDQLNPPSLTIRKVTLERPTRTTTYKHYRKNLPQEDKTSTISDIPTGWEVPGVPS